MTPIFECSESLSRRSFLAGTAALSLGALPDLSFGAEVTDLRLLVVLLRGGLDALIAMPPIGDPSLKGKRKHLLPDGLLPLDGFFALHPALKTIHDSYGAAEALLVSGISLPYQGRSHFDGQNIMESGVLAPYTSSTGWLGRALDVSGYRATALPVPLIMRGSNPSAESSYPTWISAPPTSLYQTLEKNWANNPDLAQAGAQLARKAEAGGIGMLAALVSGDDADLRMLAYQAGGQLAQPDGARVAVLDYVGFDTHAQETNEYDKRLKALDGALAGFKEAIGPGIWKKTLVVTVTEFGRTAAENGTWGTDHGWGSCVFVLGGALRKSGIVADWPGLNPADLFEGRDLKATIDARSLYTSVVSSALGIDPERARRDVLPGAPADDRFAPFLA
jgi:uncharacterized protein (DUF1501 family)